MEDGDDIRKELATHANKWHKDTVHLSFHQLEHPSFRAIVRMGPAVIPFILERCVVVPSWTILALEEITGIQPVPEDHSGNLWAITQDWIQWWWQYAQDQRQAAFLERHPQTLKL